jgi:hypothetical protein
MKRFPLPGFEPRICLIQLSLCYSGLDANYLEIQYIYIVSSIKTNSTSPFCADISIFFFKKKKSIKATPFD